MKFTVRQIAEALIKNGYPQGTGDLIVLNDDGIIKEACALGQMGLNLGIVDPDLLPTRFKDNSNENWDHAREIYLISSQIWNLLHISIWELSDGNKLTPRLTVSEIGQRIYDAAESRSLLYYEIEVE